MKLTKTFIIFSAVFFILAAVKIYSQTALNENSIKFENPTTATLVGQDGLILSTTDAGLTWSTQSSGITNVLYSNDMFTFVDPLGGEQIYQFAAGENGIILATFDKGSTWQTVTSGTTEHLYCIITRSQYEMYACGANGTMLVSYDMGTTWFPLSVNTTETLKKMALAGNDANIEDVKALAVGTAGTVLYTKDFGVTWQAGVSGITTDLNAVTFAGGQTVFAAGNTGVILKSIDGGMTWTAVTTGTALNLFDIKYLTDETKRDIIATGEDGTILISTDLGDTWTSVTSPTTNDLFSVNFGSSTFGISTGSEGTEIYTTDGGLTWTNGVELNPVNTGKKETIKLSQNYPNPFNPSTVISYSVNDNSNVNIKIYDMTGREVRTLVNSFHNAGSYSVNFNASNLSSGIYFYVLRVNTGANEITKTMKMILTK